MISTTQVNIWRLENLLLKCNLNDSPIFIFQGLHFSAARHITLNIVMSRLDKWCLKINQNYCSTHILIGWVEGFFGHNHELNLRLIIQTRSARIHRLELAIEIIMVIYVIHCQPFTKRQPILSVYPRDVSGITNKITVLNTTATCD